jgi:hypothetical protein
MIFWPRVSGEGSAKNNPQGLWPGLIQMDDWTKRFQAGWLALECLNRENEVSDAALRSPGGGECMACQKEERFLATERFCLLTPTFNG